MPESSDRRPAANGQVPGEAGPSPAWQRRRERLLLPSKALRLLRETGADSDWELRGLVAITPVKEWPERRLTVRYLALARQAGQRTRPLVLYGKLYRGSGGERSLAVLRALRAQIGSGCDLPDPLGYLARRRFLLMTGLEGVSLAEACAGPGAVSQVARAGSALASFHGAPGLAEGAQRGQSPWPRHSREAELAVLEEAKERVARSELAESLRCLYAETARAAAGVLAALPEGPAVTLHRDLYPDQIILSAARVGLIDLDAVALGEAELDLGNLAAHLWLADLQTHGRLAAAPGLASALLAAYGETQAIDRRRLASYRAAALLRLASLERLAAPARSVLPWPQLAGRLIQEARAALASEYVSGRR